LTLKPIGLTVVGTGNSGAEFLRAFAGMRGVVVRSAVSRNTDRALGVLGQVGLACPVFATLEEALQDRGVDAVVIASPSDAHAPMTIASARAGKHILLEKPAALTEPDLDEMIVEVARAGVLCQVNMILRWHPMIEAIVRHRDAGDLGDVFAVEADFIFGEIEGAEPDWARSIEGGGSVHLYAGCHAYDQLCWLMDSSIHDLVAVSTRHSAIWEFDVTAMAIMQFANHGIGRATVTLEAAAPYHFGVRVFGTKATVVDNMMFVPTDDGEVTTVELCKERVDVTGLGFHRVAEDFVSNVRLGRASHASLSSTAEVFRWAIRAERDARQRNNPSTRDHT
jgi:predicted dehydrogenase